MPCGKSATEILIIKYLNMYITSYEIVKISSLYNNNKYKSKILGGEVFIYTLIDIFFLDDFMVYQHILVWIKLSSTGSFLHWSQHWISIWRLHNNLIVFVPNLFNSYFITSTFCKWKLVGWNHYIQSVFIVRYCAMNPAPRENSKQLM